MVCSCIFGFLAIALCFLCCLCAHAEVSQRAAWIAVSEVKQLTHKAVMKAQKDYTDAVYIKHNVEARYANTKNAASKAEEAAKGNAKAIGFANEAKIALEELMKIFSSAQEKAQTAVEFTKDVLLKARVLDAKSQIPISPDVPSGNDYSKVSAIAADVKNKTQELEKEIKAEEQLLNDARFEEERVSQHAEDAQVAKYQVDAVVTVAKMETLLSEADAYIINIQQKKEEINAIAETIEKELETAPRELIHRINNFHTNAHGDLRRVTDLINEVQQAKLAMLQDKTHADEALAEIPDLTQKSEVRENAGNIVYFSNRAAEQLRKIKTALENAKSYANNSNDRKQDTLNALSSHNSKPVTVEDKKTNKPSQPVEDATTKPTSEETKEQKGTSSSQPLQDATTEKTSEDTKEEKETNPSQPVEDVTTKTTNEDTKEQQNTNPSHHFQDATIKKTSEYTKEQNGTNPGQAYQYATTKTSSEDTKEEKDSNEGQYIDKAAKRSAIKGKASPHETSNDSAVTVSFSLLLALIVCANLN